MYKQLTMCLCIGLATTFVACSKYDDGVVRSRLDKAESRLTSVESRVNTINEDLKSLRTVVDALQKGKYVTNVSPTSDGYTITFSDNTTVNLKHGAKGDKGEQGTQGLTGPQGIQGEAGKAGHTPQISVIQEADGSYYWQKDGELLLDAKGNKVKASGSQGTVGAQGASGAKGDDGVTPKLRIKNNRWEVSYDKGASWNPVPNAVSPVGPKGDDGYTPQGANLFKSIKDNGDYVSIILSNGQELKLPKVKAFTVEFKEAGNVITNLSIPANTKKSITYTLVGKSKGTLKITAEGHDGYQVRVRRDYQDRGSIEITAPASAVESTLYVFIGDDERTVMFPLKINATAVAP